MRENLKQPQERWKKKGNDTRLEHVVREKKIHSPENRQGYGGAGLGIREELKP